MAPNLAGCRIDEVASLGGTALQRMIGVRLFARSWIVGLAPHDVSCPRTAKHKEPHEKDPRCGVSPRNDVSLVARLSMIP
jgi:hypothetical protein